MAWRRFRRPRRALRRLIGRPGPAMPGRRPPGPALRQLQRANALMMAEQFAEAAQLFHQLAQKALARGFPQAPQLTLRAAEAYFKAGDRERARGRLLAGLEMLANASRWQVLRHAGERAIVALQAQGDAALAAEVRQAMERWLAQAPPLPAMRRASQALPARCPTCGAPVHPDEVEWTHGVPLCAYCGIALTANASPE